MRIFRALGALLVGVLALTVVAAPAQAAGNPHHLVVKVYHQALVPTSTNGSGLGTVRTFYAPMAVNGIAANGQYISGTLTTIAQGLPDNMELRSSNLMFVFGSEKDQLVVGGLSVYASAGATIAPGVSTVRPVVGGSGKYKGATGEVISTNLGANGWTHVFHLDLP